MAAKTSTSLARQLELLKLPQTSVHKETRGSASFLYDFFEAKSIDADTHFSVALAGLEGLTQIDPYVETFKESLFHESSKKFDRGVANKESNDKVDAIIEEFLFRVVSKYFQHSHTHKTIEWLIYRYKVNEYNTDALIGSVLPYHETRQFVRLLQTCSAVKNPRNSQWYWLKGIQESGVPLAKSVLLQHCVSSLEFVRFVTDSVFKAVHIDSGNGTFPSFLVSFCLNLLERSTSELIITMIVSVVSKAIRAKNQSLYIASYLIFSHLCSTTTLDSKVVEKFLGSFLRHIKEDVYEGALVAFTIICHTQNVETLPIKFLDNDFVFNLVHHSEAYNFGPLIKSLLLTMINVPREELSSDSLSFYKTRSRQLLEIRGVTEETVKSLVSAIKQSLKTSAVEEHLAEVEELFVHLLSVLARLHPIFFGQVICSLKLKKNLKRLLCSAGYSPPTMSTKVEETPVAQQEEMALHSESSDDEEEISANKKEIYNIFTLAGVEQEQSGSVSVSLMQRILQSLTGSTATTLSTRTCVSLINLLTHVDAETKSTVFKFYYERFFTQRASTENEPFTLGEQNEMKALLGLLRDNGGSLFEEVEEKPNYIVMFYLAMVQSTKNRLLEQTSTAVYGVLSRQMFDSIRSINEPFALKLVLTMLQVQLAFSETASSSSTSVDNVHLIGLIKRRLRKLTRNGSFLVLVLQSILPIEEIYDTFAYARNEPSAERRSRLAAPDTESKFASAWKLLRIYVGLFQSKESIDNACLLVKTLFDYLKLTFMDVDDNSNEYTRQTILNVIVSCLDLPLSKKLVTNKEGQKNASSSMDVDEETSGEELAVLISNINVDIIVDCMRESRLKETQRVALLLISLIAPHFQRQILDHLVAISTFIGTSLLQCDDQYSLAILFETLESIIPIILKSEQASAKSDMSQSDIISIFVKSFADIPSYRRLALFTKLVQLLGEDRFLSILSVRLLEDACLLKSSRPEKEVMHSFLLALFSQFSSEKQLVSLCTLLCLFERQFFDPHLRKKSLKKRLVGEGMIIGSELNEQSQQVHGKLNALSDSVCQQFTTKIVYDSDKLLCGVEMLRLIVSIISNGEFAESCSKESENTLSALLTYFLNLLLKLIVSLCPGDPSMKASLNMYRKRIKSTLDEALLKYHSLVSPKKLIIIVIDDLLANTAQLESSLEHLVKRKALELLNEKLLKLGANDVKPKFAVKLIKSLSEHLKCNAKQVNKLDDLQVHNMQLTLVSLKFSTKFLLSNTEELLPLQVEILSGALLQVCDLANGIALDESASEQAKSSRVKSMQNLKGSCILCLTQILCTMSLEGIEHLSTVVNLILSNFEVKDDIVLIANVSSLAKLIAKFAQFLSPHVRAIILKLLYAFILADTVPGLRAKLQTNWNLLAKLVPKRVVFEAIDASYEDAVAISTQSIVELMALFRLSCDNLEKADVERILKSFKQFMIKALSYRSIHHEEVSLETIEQIETSFGEAFSSFIPKLTEASFRPIFYKLLEWSVQIEKSKKLKKDKSYSLPDESYYRMIAFYRFCALLANRLKSLFCVFVAPSIVSNCSEMLLAYHSANFDVHPENERYNDFMSTQPEESKVQEGKLQLRKSNLGEPLVAAILATLSKCFLFDLNGTFVNKDCTSLIVKPIVNQVRLLISLVANWLSS